MNDATKEHPMPVETLSVGFSSCPNDIFIFEALVSGRVDTAGMAFRSTIEDVESLNLRARHRDLDITKISFHALGHLRTTHRLLESGSALGRGCGPLVISKRPLDVEELASARIAIPGALTTATLLLRLRVPAARDFEVMVFDQIIDAVEAGTVDAGLIIHESRFTYASGGLSLIIDLGEWWEEETGLPIPLGGIIADRRLGEDRIRRVDALLRESIRYARENPAEIWPAIRSHAQELDDAVIRSHIDLYVTDFTTNLGEEGHRAVDVLLGRAQEAGVLPRSG